MLDINDAIKRSIKKSSKLNPTFKIIGKTKKHKTRTLCRTVRGVITIGKYKYNVHVKISPCLALDKRGVMHHTKDKKLCTETSSLIETKFFRITNAFKNLDICDSFVYCYNDDILYKNMVKDFDTMKYSTILITHDLSNCMKIGDWLKTAKRAEIMSVLFQFVYTFSCMNVIKMTHNDLHFGNIFIEKIKNNSYDQYKFKLPNGKYSKAYVNNKYRLKIIDLDGAHKLYRSNVKSIFRPRILSKQIGSTSKYKFNKRMDTLKLLKHLSESTYKVDMKGILKDMGFVNSQGEVPYFPHRPFPTTNKYSANMSAIEKYGMFYNKRGGALPMTNSDLHEPKDILNISRKFFPYMKSYKIQKFHLYKKDAMRKFSQKRIFTSIT